MDEHSPEERDKKKEEKKREFAFLFWLLGGLHFAYLGKWGKQILFWGLLGMGFLTLRSETSVFLFSSAGIWWVVELFYLPNKLHAYTAPIFRKIKEIMKGQSPVESQQAYILSDMIQDKNYWLSKVKKIHFAFLLWLLGGGTLPIWVNGVIKFCFMLLFLFLYDFFSVFSSAFFSFLLCLLIFSPCLLLSFPLFLGYAYLWLIEIFLLENRLQAYNAPIFRKIKEIETKEKAAEQARNMAMIAEAIKSKGKAGGDKNKGEADAEGE